MSIRVLPAHISRIADLSPTAREVVLTLPEPLGFTAGAFVNVFMENHGKKDRRAYSISSSPTKQSEIALSIRKGSEAGMSERFWDADIGSVPLEIMGPLGHHTADKITHSRVFLFAFGIGISPLKGILHELLERSGVTEIHIYTASKTEDEILYREFLENVCANDARVTCTFVVSSPVSNTYPYPGYITDYIKDCSFADSTVYICGRVGACTALQEAIEAQSPKPPEFLVEDFG